MWQAIKDFFKAKPEPARFLIVEKRDADGSFYFKVNMGRDDDFGVHFCFHDTRFANAVQAENAITYFLTAEMNEKHYRVVKEI